LVPGFAVAAFWVASPSRKPTVMMMSHFSPTKELMFGS
jgi:hypothetical protein